MHKQARMDIRRVWIDVEEAAGPAEDQIWNQLDDVDPADRQDLWNALRQVVESDWYALVRPTVHHGFNGYVDDYIVNGNAHHVWFGVRHGFPGAAARFEVAMNEPSGLRLVGEHPNAAMQHVPIFFA
jgi:hypothetical protein